MAKDGKIKAKAKGKRVSKAGKKNQYGTTSGGNVYYESREKHSDVAATKIKKDLKSGKITVPAAIKKVNALVKKGKMK